MEYDRAAVLEAWKKAVNYGIIDSDKLRPEIARAWARCMSLGVDPWSSEFPKCDDKLLASIRKKHAAVMDVASPVMQYLLTVFNCNVSIADMHGFVFDLITPLSAYPRTLGTYVTEALTGCGNLPMAITEKKAARVDGYEHFRSISQNYSGVAAIIHGVGAEDYVLCMNDPFLALPPSALDICISAADLVERLGASRREAFSHLSSATFFDPLLENGNASIIVTDQDGMLLTANTGGKVLIPGYEESPYASKSLGEYLCNKHVLADLLDDAVKQAPDRLIGFRGGARQKGIEVKLARRKIINLMNGMKNYLFVFENSAQPELEETAPLRRSADIHSDYIGQSSAWQKVDELVRSVAAHRSNVMIIGDTGTGKEVVARALHRLSGRDGEFVAINCGALPRELLASELFGYEGGAFTGARSSGAKGKFEYANGGTLFLDEIGDMPIDMQVSLLRVLQEQCVTRIGSNKPVPFNVRVIAATNQDMHRLIEEGKFRLDLWYRLSVIEIYLPRLNERDEDIALLADYFNKSLSESLNICSSPLSREVLAFLESYDWPGNVRELKNVMEKALIIANGRPVSVDSFPQYMKVRQTARREHQPLTELPLSEQSCRAEKTITPAEVERRARIMRRQREREEIIAVLEEERGNISRSAKRLNISRNTLYRKIEKLDIQIKVQAFMEKE